MKNARSGPMADRIFGWLAKGAAIFTLATLAAILISLTIRCCVIASSTR